jgi:putative salt-induced outer membrane protein YdiY
MSVTRVGSFLLIVLSASVPVLAQPPAPQEPPPPPLWDLQLGAAFVGTSGNTDTTTTGADFSANRRGLVWLLEATAKAVHTTTDDETTAERYLGDVRGRRKLNELLGLSTGAKLERDRFAGVDFRSILDGGLSWALVHDPKWTLDGVTSIAWLHESRTDETTLNDPIGVLQVLSRIPFGAAGDTTQRFTYYPDFKTAAAYRSEFEVTAQAALNSRLALKFGYLVRYSNDPLPTFEKTDTTTTASIVLRFKAATPAPTAP